MFSNPETLISVIMPAYNAALFIREAINSVINQSFINWELIIIDDGSEDNTQAIVLNYNDKRIKYFFQKNLGVSSARNKGLLEMKGNFFCFLDADDVLPVKSLENRVEVFKMNPDLSFVDGIVVFKNANMTQTLKIHKPDFKGYPFDELLRLNGKCLFGNTWMIKRTEGQEFKFDESMSHAEDLYFYLTISKNRLYDFTNSEILHYRITGKSAMSKLRGLEDGYFKLYKYAKSKLSASSSQLCYLKYKITRIMVLSYFFDSKEYLNAIRVFWRFILL